MKNNKLCVIDDCQGLGRGRFHLCLYHDRRVRNGIMDEHGNILREHRNRQTGKTCLKDCGAQPKVAGMCNYHYNKSRLSHLVDEEPKVREDETIEVIIGGVRYVKANGLPPITSELIAAVLAHLAAIDYTDTL